MSQLVTTIENAGTAYDDVLGLVKARYGSPLYEPADADTVDPVMVRMSARQHSPVCLADEFRHTVLGFTLFERLGRERVSSAFLQEAEFEELLTEVNWFAINGIAQNELFEAFASQVPEWIASFFPIESPQYRLACDHVEVVRAKSDLASRHIVAASLSLLRSADNHDLESRTVAIANFFGPTQTGRVKEPGRNSGRPFDEIATLFHCSIGTLLSLRAPESLRKMTDATDLRILQILELDDS